MNVGYNKNHQKYCRYISIFVLFLAYFSVVSPAVAQESLGERVAALSDGSIDLDEFSSWLIEGVQTGRVPVASIDPSAFSSIYGFESIFGRNLDAAAFEFLTNGDRESALQIEALANQVLEPQSRERQNISRFIQLKKNFDNVLEAEDLGKFDSFIASVVNPKEVKLLDSTIGSPIQELITRLQESGRSAYALSWLSRVPNYAQTADWTVGVFNSVQGMAGVLDSTSERSGDWPFDDERTFAMVQEARALNTDLNTPLGKIYSQKVRDSLVRNDIKKARLYYERVLGVRDDPHEENTLLRKEIVELADPKIGRDFVLGRIQEMKSNDEIDLSRKILFFRKGYSGGRGKQLTLIFLVLLLGFYASYLFVKKLLGEFLPKPSFEMEDYEEEDCPDEDRQEENPISEEVRVELEESGRGDSIKPSVASRLTATSGGFSKGAKFERDREEIRESLKAKFTGAAGYKEELTAEDEYSKLLAVFDLDDSCVFQDIKDRYRTLLKEYHPDTTEHDPEEAAAKLSEIKASYKRIETIQKSWFGGKKN